MSAAVSKAITEMDSFVEVRLTFSPVGSVFEQFIGINYFVFYLLGYLKYSPKRTFLR